jgi:hypothetical protein
LGGALSHYRKAIRRPTVSDADIVRALAAQGRRLGSSSRLLDALRALRDGEELRNSLPPPTPGADIGRTVIMSLWKKGD